MTTATEPILAESERRETPWRSPATGDWRVFMRWHDLGLLHWPVSADALRRCIPQGLKIDAIDGQAWLSIVPFRMTNVHLHGLPPAPTAGAFPELNVRTYVTDGRTPGIWFFSLDAPSWLAVVGGRLTYRLRYYHAALSLTRHGSTFDFRSQRRHFAAPAAKFRATYRPLDTPRQVQAGTLESWLINRYRLYTADRGGRVFHSDIEHAPWLLQPAEAVVEHCTMTDSLGIKLPRRPALVHFSSYVESVAWPLEETQ